MSYRDDTFTAEDLGKALLLKDEIERKNIRNYNNLNNDEKEHLLDCADGRENVAKFFFDKIIEEIDEDKKNQN